MNSEIATIEDISFNFRPLKSTVPIHDGLSSDHQHQFWIQEFS